MKKKPTPFSAFDSLKSYWGIITVVIGFVSACAVFPFKLQAAEKKISELQESQKILIQQSTQIGAWIEQSKKETDMKKKAPKGFRYEESIGEYIEWKDDPRLKIR